MRQDSPAGSQAALPKPGQSIRDFVREYTSSLLAKDKTQDNLIRTVAKMDAIAEMEIARLRKDGQGAVACRLGCDHCCHRIVGVSVSEAIQIAVRVQTRFSQQQRQVLLSRCVQYANATKSLRRGLEILGRPACPFLENRQCTIYDVRPAGCRGYNSRDVAACGARAVSPLPAPARGGRAGRTRTE